MISEAADEGKLTRSDLKMIETAVRRNWELPDELFRKLPAEAAKMFLDKEKPDRTRLAALRAILTMNKQNIGLDSDQSTDVTVNVDVQIAQANEIRREMIHDPEYLDYLRTRARNGDPGANGNGHKPKSLEDGSAA